MKISLNWLREYVDFPEPAAELASLLTMAGVEAEGIVERGVNIPKVVVARILESNQHPNADRLSVCRVDDGSGQPRQIVCGAKNYRVGDNVPLALPGAILPGDFRIKVGKLRGVESEGMLCSAKELALAEDAEGLLILPGDAVPGTPIGELFPADTILDLEVTPNRPDLLSHAGMAREVSALTRRTLKPHRPLLAETNFSSTVIDEAEECPVYTVRKITGVKVGPSPAWLRQRLEAIGVRSINNVVDITNYVMMELGQPLHAFDADKLEGDLRVRLALEGEEFHALDGRLYKLASDNLVVADSRRAVALAGVMGGAATGVSAETTNVWLESAYFQASSIRHTSRTLNLLSDSSYRFEREVDPAGVLVASQHAAELICEAAGGTPGELRIGFAANAQFGFDPQAARDGHAYTGVVPFRYERVCDVLGVAVQRERVDEILSAFGLLTDEGGWQVPSFRPDLTREIDLIEEIARVIGIGQIPGDHIARFAPGSEADRAYDAQMQIRRSLAGNGLHEARSLTLISEEMAALPKFLPLDPSSLRRVKNPMNAEQVILRPSLLPGLLRAIRHNVHGGASSIRLFEMGRVFLSDTHEERTHLAIVLSGPMQARSWKPGNLQEADLFHLKSVLGNALPAGTSFEPAANPALALALRVRIAGEDAGMAGQLWPADARALDAPGPVFIAEIAIGNLRSGFEAMKYRDLPRYPAVTRDMALMAPLDLPHARIVAALEGAREPLLSSVELFDLFTDPSGEKVAADKKSLAYSLTYRATERTLTADEVNAAHGRLKERLVSELGVALRE